MIARCTWTCGRQRLTGRASHLDARITMPVELVTLLRRDHADLQKELSRLLDPDATIDELRGAIDGVRLGLTAHAEAEDIVLGAFEDMPVLGALVGDVRAAHRVQETLLGSLVSSRPGTPSWRELAYQLRELVRRHAVHEEVHVVPVLRGRAEYPALAGAFATERLRQLAMLQPSVPMFGSSPLAAIG